MNREKKTLLELRTKGFAKLRPGRIHIRCPRCGRKQSNAPRSEWDMPNAFLIEVACDKSSCSGGCKELSSDFYDENGKLMDLWKWHDQQAALQDGIKEDELEEWYEWFTGDSILQWEEYKLVKKNNLPME